MKILFCVLLHFGLYLNIFAAEVVKNNLVFYSSLEKQAYLQLTNHLKNKWNLIILEESSFEIPSNSKLLFMIHPKNLSKRTLEKLDQFLIRGGRLFLAVDPLCRFEIISDKISGKKAKQIPYYASNLSEFLKSWGIFFDTRNIVGDQTLGLKIAATNDNLNKNENKSDKDFFIHPLVLNIFSKNIDSENLITKNIHNITFYEPGSFISKIKSEKIFYTTKNSGIQPATSVAFMESSNIAKTFKTDYQERILGLFLSGMFQSPFSKKITAKTKIIIMSDVDMFFTNYLNKSLKNDNILFLEQSLETLLK